MRSTEVSKLFCCEMNLFFCAKFDFIKPCRTCWSGVVEHGLSSRSKSVYNKNLHKNTTTAPDRITSIFYTLISVMPCHQGECRTALSRHKKSRWWLSQFNLLPLLKKSHELNALAAQSTSSKLPFRIRQISSILLSAHKWFCWWRRHQQ